MKSTDNSALYKEPTHEEIALAAFLAWEKDGRQPGREMNYWLQAEAEIRAARQKKAEATNQSAPVWPRPMRAMVKPTEASKRAMTPKARAAGGRSVTPGSKRAAHA
jgi:hypothetical protein